MMAVALMTRASSDAKPVPNESRGKKPPAALALPPLNGRTPAVSPNRVGTLRLVPVTRLPSVKQPILTNAQCARSAPLNPSPQAKAAITAGWHVSADTFVDGYQFVMVDAGAEKGSAGCAAIGASALVFNAHGLIAIAYDRNTKQSSRLGSLTLRRTGALQLEALRGPLAEIIVDDHQIRLKQLTASRQTRASR